MTTGPDFAVFSPDRQLQLVVEVKGTPRTDSNWAAKLRRNLLSHGAVPQPQSTTSCRRRRRPPALIGQQSSFVSSQSWHRAEWLAVDTNRYRIWTLIQE
jgi:hypothetical protein